MSETNEQHSLRIFTIISQIEQLLESAPKPKLGGGNRRTLDIGEVFDLLGDLKVTIPEDIRRAKSVLLEADTLLEHANEDAVSIVDQAQKEADQIHVQAVAELEETRRLADEEFEARVAENNVLLETQRRCELLQQHAEHSANVVYNGAKQYADAILEHLQNYLTENYQRVEQNRQELGIISAHPPVASQPIVPTPPPQRSGRETERAHMAPVEPVAPQSDAQLFEDEAEAWEPRRKRGLFHRAEADLFLDEENDETAQAQPIQEEAPRRRSRKQREKDLDIDLDAE